MTTQRSILVSLHDYLFGIGCVLIAAVVRVVLLPWVGLDVPFITFFVAVSATAWYRGLGPALFASLLSALLAVYLFLPPLWSLQGSHHLIPATLFCAEAMALAYLTDLLHQHQRELGESEERFRTLADSAPALIWVNGLEGCQYVNRGYLEFLGVDISDIQGYDWVQFVHPDDREQYIAAYQYAVGQQETFHAEFRFRRHDGVYRWMRSVGKPRYTTDGSWVGYAGLTSDITEQREMQLNLQSFTEELERQVDTRTADLVDSQRRLRELATELNLAEQRERKRLATELHDHLQQILVVGKMAIGQGKRAATGVPQCEQALQKVDDLLSDALAYSRTLVAELSPSVLHEFGLPAALRWLGEQMKRFELTVTVQIQTPEELRLSEDQAILLFQSTRELLINTAKHAETKEAIIRVTQEDGTLRLIVQDQGIGFDPTVAQQSGSTKFGLLSIRERMYAMGGRWEIHSASGKGTTAILSLPYESVSGPVEKGIVASSNAGIVMNGHPVQAGAICRILLVDDHVMVRQGLKSLLDAYPDLQVVGEADNGQDAVDLAARLQPSIILMDINMPKMNGIEATTRIKTRWPQILVFGLSVNASEDNAGAMKQAGATRIMTKEAAVDELYGAIQEALKVSVSASS